MQNQMPVEKTFIWITETVNPGVGVKARAAGTHMITQFELNYVQPIYKMFVPWGQNHYRTLHSYRTKSFGRAFEQLPIAVHRNKKSGVRK